MTRKLDDMAKRALPCPFCGEKLVVKEDHHGEWIGHKRELGPCWESVAQIHDENSLRDWNTRAPADHNI